MLIASKELLFTDFKKDEYRAFRPLNEDKPIHLQAIHERLLPVLMELEKRMSEGDTLSIVVSIKNAAPDFDAQVQAMANNIVPYRGFGSIITGQSSGSIGNNNAGSIYVPPLRGISFP